MSFILSITHFLVLACLQVIHDLTIDILLHKILACTQQILIVQAGGVAQPSPLQVLLESFLWRREETPQIHERILTFAWLHFWGREMNIASLTLRLFHWYRSRVSCMSYIQEFQLGKSAAQLTLFWNLMLSPVLLKAVFSSMIKCLQSSCRRSGKLVLPH